MVARHKIYRSLIRFYPREFRAHYGDDLVQAFADLRRDRGTRAALGRTAVDLIVTLPRYRLESIMSPQRSGTILFATIVLLAASGLASVLMGVSVGAVLLLVAAILAVAQRSALARALDAPRSHRRRRLLFAAASAVIFIGSFWSYLLAIGDEHIGNLSLIVHSVIGMFALIGAVGFLVAGLFTGRTLRSAGTTAA